MSVQSANSQRTRGSLWTSRHQAFFESGLILLLASLLVWKGFIPGWKTLNTDFPNYYIVATLIREHFCLDRIYDWIWLQRIAIRFGVEHQVIGFLGLTPFSAFPILPFTWLPVLEAKRLWMICNAVLLIASIHALNRISRLNPRRSWLLALCVAIPLRNSFLLGQMHILVLGLLVAAYVSHMRGRQLATGVWIALAAALKIYPIFFCLYFIAKRRWKGLAATLAVTTLCLLLSSLIAGTTPTRIFLLQQLPRSLQGESTNPFLISVSSSSSLFHRLFLFEPELNPHPLLASPALYAILYPLWQAMLTGLILSRLRLGFRSDNREALEWSMFLCLLMFLSSTPATYQFVVLIAAAIPTFAALAKLHRSNAIAVYLFLLVAACNVGSLRPTHPIPAPFTPLLYLRLWIGVALLIFYGSLLKPEKPDKHQWQYFRVPAFKAAAIILCLWIAGAASAWTHLKHLHIASESRVTLPDSAYLRTTPRQASAGLLYVAMRPEGYRILRDNASLPGPFQANPSAANELSFASEPSGNNIWVEEASATGSQLQMSSVSEPRRAKCEITNAESPALSASGSILGFLREDHGHGSLWTVNLHDCTSQTPVGITSAEYDVRTVSTGPLEHNPDGSFLIAAVYRGRESIFLVSLSQPPQRLNHDNGTLDSPVISPNGTLVAMRKLIANRWQLLSLDLSSGAERQLTFGDCNAYTPSWKDDSTLLYATDCGRGLGLTAIATLPINR